MPSPTRLRRSRAFTLIELIAVVIIIAVLAAIAGVAYNQFVGQSRTTAVRADVKQLSTALTARSGVDDQTPTEIVKAHPADLLTHLQVAAAASMTVTPKPDTTAPTAVEVADGTRHACLTLSDQVGGVGTVTDGTCSAGTPAVPAVSFADDFNRADGPLGTHWTTVGGTPAVSGQVVLNGDTADSIVLSDVVAADGRVSATVVAKYGPAGHGLIFDYRDASNYYRLTNGVNLRVYRYVDGVPTQVAYTSAANPGSVLSVDVRGSRVTVLVDAAAKTSFDLTTSASSGTWGFYVSPSSKIDDFTFTSAAF